MNFEVKGKVIRNPEVSSGVSKNGQPWTTAVVVIEYEDGQFATQLALENRKDANEFAKLRIGQTGVFRFGIRSREWNGKWFTSAVCFGWTMEQPMNSVSASPADPRTTATTLSDKDNLPF